MRIARFRKPTPDGVKLVPAALGETARASGRWTRRASMSRRSASIRSGTRPTATSPPKLIRMQNEKLAECCASQAGSLRCLRDCSPAAPDLAVAAVRRRQEARAARYFGRRQRQWRGARRSEIPSDLGESRGARRAGVHPSAGLPPSSRARLQGNGGLENMIGNPLETTIALSHLIFEGTLDRYPGLRSAPSHGGGFLASYVRPFRRRLPDVPRSLHRCRSRRSRPST